MSPDRVHELNARTNRWLRRLAIVVAALLLALNAITAAGVAWVALDGRDQARLNQRHIDCLAAFLIRRNPDGCQDVREQLIRDGILPADQGGNPLTTTTTTRGTP